MNPGGTSAPIAPAPLRTSLSPEQADALLRLFDPAIKLESWSRNNTGPSGYETLYGLGQQRSIELRLDQHQELLAELRDLRGIGGWTFLALSYDLKAETCLPEKRLGRLNSGNPDRRNWPDLLAWEPQFVLGRKGEDIYLLEGPLEDLPKPPENKAVFLPPPGLKIQSDVDRKSYLGQVASIRQHIREGDVYELNYCQEFYAELPPACLDPWALYQRLGELSKAPFSAFLRKGQDYVCCASPERFLQLKSNKLLSQPIKGTAARGRYAEEDRFFMAQLVNSEKDRAENVMIVDLVRNDLARVCKSGSVKVPELFGRHTFPTVHHLISSVTGDLKEDFDGIDAIEACFPMGSMTGAPKIRAMELIESHESFRRGLYSGSIGYFTPSGDFDLNVVIRTIFWNHDNGLMSFPIGGAITWDSVAESEYAECMIKADGIRRVLAGE